MEHPLRAIVTEAQIPLWKLRFFLGGSPSECTLSPALRGIEQMPVPLESKIKQVLAKMGVDG
jgi:hypothetical protein